MLFEHQSRSFYIQFKKVKLLNFFIREYIYSFFFLQSLNFFKNASYSFALRMLLKHLKNEVTLPHQDDIVRVDRTNVTLF